MNRKRWVTVFVAFQVACVLALIGAIIALDDEWRLGLLAVFRRGTKPGEILGAAIAIIAVVGTWWLLSGESYQFRVRDRVSTPVGPGTVRRRSKLHGNPVYDIQFDGGDPITFAGFELKLLPRSKPQRPWYRPRRARS